MRRLLLLKFELGLFDDPYVDEDEADRTVGRPDFTAAGQDAQRRSLTLLKNNGPLLPLAPGTRVYAPDLGEDEIRRYGVPVLSRPRPTSPSCACGHPTKPATLTFSSPTSTRAASTSMPRHWPGSPDSAGWSR